MIIEIMVVLAIICAIAGLVINHYVHAMDTGDSAAAQLELAQVVAAMDAYRGDKGVYPNGSGTAITASVFGGSGNQYMNSMPTDKGQNYYLFSGWGGADYMIMDGAYYDGAVLQNLKTMSNGTTPVPGTTYSIRYTPRDGMFAFP